MCSSIFHLLQNIKKTIVRFPIALMFWLAFFVLPSCPWIEEKSSGNWMLFCLTGMFLALLIHLCAEEYSSMKIFDGKKLHPKAFLYWIIPFALFASDHYLMSTIENSDKPLEVAHWAGIFALFVGICFLPFRQQKDDVVSWNFTLKLILNCVLALLFSIMAAVVFTILAVFIITVFDVKCGPFDFLVVPIYTILSIWGTLWLMKIPESEKKNYLRYAIDKFTPEVFLGVIMICTGVFCIFCLYVVFSQTFPNGGIVKWASCLMLAYICVHILYYPYNKAGFTKEWECKALRWLPVAILPVLILMSVAIGRRICDYGMTANRFYALVLNLWFYGVTLGIFFSKNKKIRWIPISAALLLVLISCHPWSCNAVYQHYLENKCNTIVEKYPLPKGPDRSMRDYLKSMPEDDARAAFAIFNAMDDYDYRLYGKLVRLDSPYGDYESFMGIKQEVER